MVVIHQYTFANAVFPDKPIVPFDTITLHVVGSVCNWGYQKVPKLMTLGYSRLRRDSYPRSYRHSLYYTDAHNLLYMCYMWVRVPNAPSVMQHQPNVIKNENVETTYISWGQMLQFWLCCGTDCILCMQIKHPHIGSRWYNSHALK